jgi:drug/metabolite transporter (DMT)-like permease
MRRPPGARALLFFRIARWILFIVGVLGVGYSVFSFVTGDVQSGVIMAIMALVLLALVFVYNDRIRRIRAARSATTYRSDNPSS